DHRAPAGAGRAAARPGRPLDRRLSHPSPGSAAQDPNPAVGLAEEDFVGLVGEQAVLDHAEGGLDGGGQGGQVAVGDGAVEQVVALVGDEREAVGGAAEGGRGDQVEEAAEGGGPAEADDLDREGPGGAEGADELGGVGGGGGG